MSRKMLLMASVISLALSATAAAQSNDVTISVPLDFTRLLPDLSKVAVECTIPGGDASSPFGRDGVTGRTELNVTGGQLVTTATVVLALGNVNPPVGTIVRYTCTLSGFSTAQNAWGALFAQSNSATQNPAFRIWLNPAPPFPSQAFIVTGNFFW